MNDWNEGYVTDLGYTYGYYREMAPGAIRFALNAAGFEAPPAEGFNYCELACGQGFGLALMAAANQGGQFYGNDFNPTHIAGAQRLAADAGLTNLHLFDDSFEQMLTRDLPDFDYIALHGVWSWVGRENWHHIVEFIRRKLKIGGVVYISYNTLPGWTHGHPLREVLYRVVNQDTGAGEPMAKRIGHALDIVNKLIKVPGSFFHRTPQVVERVEMLRKSVPGYVAHEYLNRHWEPIYFAEMAEHLAAAKLSFAAHGNPMNCVDALFHTPALQQLLDGTSDPMLRETLRDMGINNPFRRDLFVRGPRRMSAATHAQSLMDRDYALTLPRARCSLEVQTLASKTTLAAAVYEPLFDALASGRATTAQLSELAPFRGGEGGQRLRRALLVAVGMAYASPCESAGHEARSAAAAAALNERLLQRSEAGAEEDLPWLASALVGSGLPCSRLEQQLARLLHRLGSDDELVQRAFEHMRQRGVTMTKDGQLISDPDAIRSELEAKRADLKSQVLPLMQAHAVAFG